MTTIDKETTRNRPVARCTDRKVSRRRVLKSAAAVAATGLAYKSMAPFVRDAKAATLELRWLGWEHYNVKSLTAEFE